ncbi:MAG: hypothetical protein R2685_12015 [Candidatus Nitrosocosmicus sp.]|nr:hypothetical protein [Candidatus Nitrosocosmicus sp.]
MLSSIEKNKTTLEELKEITRQHMKKELDIMEMMFYLKDNEVNDFYQWYINHPYCKGIREIQEFVKQRK